MHPFVSTVIVPCLLALCVLGLGWCWEPPELKVKCFASKASDLVLWTEFEDGGRGAAPQPQLRSPKPVCVFSFSRTGTILA